MATELDSFEPDWRLIEGSDLYREQFVPWLEMVREEFRTKAEAVSDPVLCREYVVASRTISHILAMPDYMIELEKAGREQENKDAERAGARDNRNWRSVRTEP